jgi:hypothetical protein
MKTKEERIAELQRRLEKVKKNLALPVSLLPPGRYSFRVEMARMKKDDQRGYDYVYVQLMGADGVKTSDRFPITDEWLWKLRAFIGAVGCSAEDLTPDNLVGRTAELIICKQKNWVFTTTSLRNEHS